MLPPTTEELSESFVSFATYCDDRGAAELASRFKRSPPSMATADEMVAWLEHERWSMLGGWKPTVGIWRSKGDPPHFVELRRKSESDGTCEWSRSPLEAEPAEQEERIILHDGFCDCDGWVYSTQWSSLHAVKIESAELGRFREGGRATARSTDRVRRRRWIKVSDTKRLVSHEELGLASESTGAEDSLAKDVFFEALGKLRQRRGVQTLGVLDPTSWMRLVMRDVGVYRSWLRAKVLLYAKELYSFNLTRNAKRCLPLFKLEAVVAGT